ncbi:MAG: adenylate cyclase [Methylobacterium brachiatum]|jgi:hypothetical protein|nr:adenylate cyclase [Methylobacterium brachiatum]
MAATRKPADAAQQVEPAKHLTPPDFYGSLPRFTTFSSLMDPALYRPLPTTWWLGVADVVGSQQQIGLGRYKAVNAAGAAIIAAVSNALGRREFPFVFGGDGASFAIGPEDVDTARQALAATAVWVREALHLELRTALLPVSAVRDRGLDVRVARYAPSAHVSYAMFSGGGLPWAEAAMKAGDYAVAPAEPGSQPDLTGLSCRWQEIRPRHALMLSLMLVPQHSGDAPAFRQLVQELLYSLEISAEVARPMQDDGPQMHGPWMGLDLELRAMPGCRRSRLWPKLRLVARSIPEYLLYRTGLRLGAFDPAAFRHEIVGNTDFRKYDDALRMTLDCTEAFADRLEAQLAAAEAQGICHFGLERQSAAQLTCISPPVPSSGHMHFIDGAGGGYAAAAARLKGRAARVEAVVPTSP